ncbi:MAG: hypothetical protein S4CHLAM2_03730 [Chlamydiales bacterium]|nr:hypothetical protein [Chlamydiales bacterium]
MKYAFYISFALLFCPLSNPLAQEIEARYQESCEDTRSDIYEHLPPLKQLASECSSVAEIGIRSVVSTWALLCGLSEAASSHKTYTRIELDLPPYQALSRVKTAAQTAGITYNFWLSNDMTINLPPVDLLFIDSLHTYCHLMHELEKFSPQVSRYIVLHETHGPWSARDDLKYSGDFSEYDPSIDRSKKGVWAAVVDFLSHHPEWCLYENRKNKNGLTVLKRTALVAGVQNSDPDTEATLKQRMILCTGPSLNKYTDLKLTTENDLKLIPFKKIFLSTNDPNNSPIDFNGKKPVVSLIPCQGHQLDCTNSIFDSLYQAATDPSCESDDIILYRHESSFINDMYLVKQAIRKINEGYAAVTRTTPWVFDGVDMSNGFFIKVGALRKVLSHPSLLFSLVNTFPTTSPYTEAYLTHTLMEHLGPIYRIELSNACQDCPWTQWGHTELGFFHSYRFGSSYPFEWKKENYFELYNWER